MGPIRHPFARRALLGLALLLVLTQASDGAATRTYGQLTVDNTTGGVALTAAVIAPPGLSQINHCLLRLEAAEIRFRIDGGAPTTTVGTPMEVLEVLQIDAAADLRAYRAIRTGATSGTLNMTCWN